MKASDKPIIITVDINASRIDIWAALTELELMNKWFFENIPNFKAEIGFETTFDIYNEDRLFRHEWKVLEVISEQSITTQWTFTGYDGVSNVTFSIQGNGPSHSVTVKAWAVEDHDTSIPEFRRESGVGGWTYFMNERLKGFCESM